MIGMKVLAVIGQRCRSPGMLGLEACPLLRGLSRTRFCGLGLEDTGLSLGLEGRSSPRPSRGDANNSNDIVILNYRVDY